jgi:hypothetical protein
MHKRVMMKLPKKLIAEIRRQRTLAAGGNRLGGVTKTARHKVPRAITLATIRCLRRNDDEAKP